MVTSLLLYLALLPAQLPLDPCLLDARPEQAALSPLPIGGRDHLGLIGAESADEESETEEEEVEGQGLALSSPAEGDHAGLIVSLRRWNGSLHLRNARDRRRFSRSPPEDGPLPANHCVRAAIG